MFDLKSALESVEYNKRGMGDGLLNALQNNNQQVIPQTNAVMPQNQNGGILAQLLSKIKGFGSTGGTIPPVA